MERFKPSEILAERDGLIAVRVHKTREMPAFYEVRGEGKPLEGQSPYGTDRIPLLRWTKTKQFLVQHIPGEANPNASLHWGFRAFLEDGVIRWSGIDMGETTVVHANPNRGLIALKIAGSHYWSSIGHQSYAPGHYDVARYVKLGENEFRIQWPAILSWGVRAEPIGIVKSTITVEQAARELSDYLFEKAGSNLPPLGFVGHGIDRLMVRVHAKQKDYRGPTPIHWKEYPIEWRFGIGPIRPLGLGIKS